MAIVRTALVTYSCPGAVRSCYFNRPKQAEREVGETRSWPEIALSLVPLGRGRGGRRALLQCRGKNVKIDDLSGRFFSQFLLPSSATVTLQFLGNCAKSPDAAGCA